MGIVDHYTFQARLLPALIVVLPLGLVVVVFQPSQSAAINFLAGALVSFGLTALLSQLGRDLGKRKEADFFTKTGGKPSTLMLSFRSSTLDRETLARCHAKLQSMVPNLRMPTQEEESKNTTDAFVKYDSCVSFLREKTRDKKRFPLVYSENVNYGFRRNLWGMKSAGIVIATLGIIGCIITILYHLVSSSHGVTISIAALMINIALFVWWVLRIRFEWVKLAAFAYARQLILSCEIL